MRNESLRDHGKRKTRERMRTAYEEDDEKKGRVKQEATKPAKDRKAFRKWLIQPVA
jgi:hypothetical protein